MDKKHIWFAAGYLIGSFFGVSQILGLFSGVSSATKSGLQG